MYSMDFYNEIVFCRFLCARLISVCFYGSLFRLPRRGLPSPYRCTQANRPPRLQGYHTRATTLQTNFWVQAGQHTCRQFLVNFPFFGQYVSESFYSNNFSTEPGAHRTDPLNTTIFQPRQQFNGDKKNWFSFIKHFSSICTVVTPSLSRGVCMHSIHVRFLL